ncbi:OLC1v1014702C3 [Oldenlandia corymbosa var. corymbosa]|uniref:OLC1v1014702C3 n=1 Tax=Oldenlandia corymbosa var. corymbosa TaxID=529605 RepID=A0AAV1E3R4_OLDCO|nr:OLC1v1014702C3 [Oldenlandia corymbosa var. corymbosa]
MAEEAREEEVEYESDPEEAKLSLKMRRREASDDEEEVERDGEVGEVSGGAKPRRRLVDSDVESDGQGAAANYEDEEEEEDYVEDEEEYVEEDDEYVEELEEEAYEDGRGQIGGVEAVAKEREVVVEGKEDFEDGIGSKPREGVDGSNEHRNFDEISNDNQQGDGEVDGDREEEEKKENEPFAVPTAGAFYMHDDRFRDSSGGRHRRTFGGRKLWESKDEKKWGHDKFEELTQQERHYDDGRRISRGRYRGRGRGRGAERGGFVRGSKPRSYVASKDQTKNNQSNVPKSVRGRGPRKYQASFKNNDEVASMPNQQSGKTADKPSHSGSGRVSAPTSNVASEAVQAKKNVFASSLNSASPPFYPSTSASKEIPLAQKRDVQSGTSNRRTHSSGEQNFSTAQSSSVQRGKVAVDSIGMDKLYIDDSLSTVSGKPSTNTQFPSGSTPMNATQPLPMRAHGRGMNSLPQMTYQPTGATSQGNRISPSNQFHPAKRNLVQGRGQPSFQASGQQFVPTTASGSQVSSPPKATLVKSSFETGEKETTSDISKSKAALVVKGKGAAQGSGRGSFLYGGAQVMGASGNLGSGPGDQNFPAFLPVMQFGGQHPGGIGVPAVGMAFPGYVAQPQLGGLGNSEMTWLPVLAGAAGALGATYCSPYMSMDGSYSMRPSGPASSAAAASLKENNADKPSNEWNPSSRPEVSTDDFGQRQKNPRRYTEMKFDQ